MQVEMVPLSLAHESVLVCVGRVSVIRTWCVNEQFPGVSRTDCKMHSPTIVRQADLSFHLICVFSLQSYTESKEIFVSFHFWYSRFQLILKFENTRKQLDTEYFEHWTLNKNSQMPLRKKIISGVTMVHENAIGGLGPPAEKKRLDSRFCDSLWSGDWEAEDAEIPRKAPFGVVFFCSVWAWFRQVDNVQFSWDE